MCRMETYPIAKGICTECEFEVIIIFVEHSDEISMPLYCPHCASKLFEGVELNW